MNMESLVCGQHTIIANVKICLVYLAIEVAVDEKAHNIYKGHYYHKSIYSNNINSESHLYVNIYCAS